MSRRTPRTGASMESLSLSGEVSGCSITLDGPDGGNGPEGTNSGLRLPQSGAAEKPKNAGPELRSAERLGHVVVGAAREGLHDVLRRAVGREKKHREPRGLRVFSDVAAKLEAVHP